MKARIKNPAISVPGVLDAFEQLGAAASSAGIPETTLYLAALRASQINGCSVCVDIHTREIDYAGEISERIDTVAAWRETPYFSDAERAALALTEAATRLADRPDPVPDEVWDEAPRHYGEPSRRHSWSRSRPSTRTTASTRLPGRSPACGRPGSPGRPLRQSEDRLRADLERRWRASGGRNQAPLGSPRGRPAVRHFST
jgi:AhpD family alkylhydroperoxidase